MISRSINLPFKKNSVFLFGPRQVGKSTLVRHLLSGAEHIEIDLLKSDALLKYMTNPSQLRAECDFLVKRKKKACSRSPSVIWAQECFEGLTKEGVQALRRIHEHIL